MEEKEQSKSIDTPIKRLPGQALREERDKLFEEQVGDPLMFAALGLAYLGLECLHVFTPIKPSVWIGCAVAAATVAFAAYKCISVRKKLKAYKRGEEGERIVAKAIEETLIPNGYRVVHDIQLMKDKKQFNIDHLIIGKNGVFAVETKNYSKNDEGGAKVTYDGKIVLWNGRRRGKNAAAQAESAASDAKKRILRKTGMSIDVRPVLCAVGWCAESSNLYRNPVLLVMEKTIGTVIPRVLAQRYLTEEEQMKIYQALI